MPWLLLRLLTTTRCGSSATSGASVGGRSSVVNAPKLSSTMTCRTRPLQPRDELHERVVRDEPAVGVVGIDDHDGVRRVALDQRVELVEVER